MLVGEAVKLIKQMLMQYYIIHAQLFLKVILNSCRNRTTDKPLSYTNSCITHVSQINMSIFIRISCNSYLLCITTAATRSSAYISFLKSFVLTLLIITSITIIQMNGLWTLPCPMPMLTPSYSDILYSTRTLPLGRPSYRSSVILTYTFGTTIHLNVAITNYLGTIS